MGARTVGAPDGPDRAGDLAVLTDHLVEVADAAGARTAVVRGGPESERTALVADLAARAAARGFTVLAAGADPGETDIEYGVLDQLLRRAGRREQPCPATTRVPPDSAPDDVGRWWAEVLDAEAALAPVLVVVEDVDHADEASTRVLAGVSAPRLLTVLVTASATASTTGPGPVHVLDVGAPGPRVAVGDVLAVRAALPAGTRALLDALAVLAAADGRALRNTVAELAGVEVGDLAPALDAGLVREDGGEVVAFAVDGAGDVVHGALPPTRRVVLHARAVDLVGPDAAWTHRVAAAPAVDGALGDQLERAAEEHGRHGRHDLAARLLRWSEEHCATVDDRERRCALAGLHEVFSAPWTLDDDRRRRLQAMRPTALRALTLGLAAVRDPGDRRGHAWLVEAAEWAGEPPHPGEPTSAWTRAVADAGLVRAHTLTGSDEQAVRHARRALAGSELPVRLADHVRVFGAVSRARIEGPRAALVDLEALPPQPDPARRDVIGFRGALRMSLGHIGAARADLETALSRHPNGTVLMPDMGPEPFLSQICYLEGEWDDAFDLTAAPAAADEEHEHNRFLRLTCRVTVLGGRGELDEAAALVREMQEALRPCAPSPQRQLVSIATATVTSYGGDVDAALSALSWLRDVEVGDPAHTWWSHWWRPVLIGILVACGENDEALVHIAAFREEAKDAPYLRVVHARHAALVAALDGDPDGAIAVGDAYLSDTRPVLFPHLHAVFQHDHAVRLLAAQRRTEAVTLLQAAHATFTDLGSTPFAAAVASDLERCGAGDRRRALGVYGVLTHRESQVVDLVLRDRLNREIAEELHITVRTVEYHLRNVFGKFGVRTRAQLRRSARPLSRAADPSSTGNRPSRS